MKSRRRAIRRHHRRRVIRRARWIFDVCYGDLDLGDWAAKNHDHLKKCSCWMCGNFRKTEGPTYQELRDGREPVPDVPDSFEIEPDS